jgi:hypothetical protein
MARASLLVSALFVPIPTVCVIPVSVSEGLGQAVPPVADNNTHTLLKYWVAPTEGPGIPALAADMYARSLEKEMRKKLADDNRVKEASDIYRKFNSCPDFDYPCEVVVEEVNQVGEASQVGAVLYFRLELKMVRPPRDRSTRPPHPGIDDQYKCTVTQDMSADDCRSEAPEKLAHALKVHDQRYHPRNP